MPTVSIRTIPGGNPNGDESGAVGVGWDTASQVLSVFDGTTKYTIPTTVSASTISGKIDADKKVVASSITYDSVTTLATITGFSWTVVAGATYVFDVELNTTQTTTGGLKVGFGLTTATLTSIRYNYYQSTATDNGAAVSGTGTTTTSGTAIVDNKTAAYTRTRIWGSFVVNAGGTFAFQAAQNTSAGTTDVSIILIGSQAEVKRVL